MTIFSNLLLVLKKKTYLAFFLIFSTLFYFIMDYFTHSELIIGNYGVTYFYLQIISQLSIAILFSLFLTLTIFKILFFSTISIKDTTTSGFAGFFGMIIAGCPACSITLATYLGLTGIIAFFPYDGLELKIGSIPILLYAIYSTLSSLTVCKFKK